MMKQTLGSAEEYTGYTYDVGSYRDSTRYAAQQDDAQLQDFFCRPIKVLEIPWAVGSDIFLQFNPWSDFFQNPRVINRLSNYNVMRSDLRVKFLITGNGFHYGRVLVSYNPLGPQDDFVLSRALIPQDAIAESQRPHVYLDPTTSQGGEIKCPFFWYNDALSIPSQDWQQMGNITVRSLNTLKHANGSIDVVTITALVWAENVEMSIPTSAEPGSISPQAMDEYASNPVSAPASLVARVAGRLVDVPGIGLYAKATELAASAVASVARLFGFSRPRVLEDIMPYTPRYMGNLASTNAGDNSMSLAVENKQELSIDPRIVGLTEADELDIQTIAARELFLTNFPWSTSDAPETTLFSIRVTPVQWDQETATNGYALTPSALAAVPFAFWRCKMCYRFQVVSSNYHKGKLRFVWDPHGFASNEFNVNYTQIVDIAMEKDFNIEIAWGQDTHFCITANIAGASSKPFSASLIGDAGNSQTNGVLRVLVLNELTTPNSDINNDVQVNVFTKACDLEVAVPDATEINALQWFPDGAGAGEVVEPGEEPPEEDPITPQAEVMVDGDDTASPSAPEQDIGVRTMGTEIQTTDPTYHVYFGEVITSFRQMLKRFVFSEAFSTSPAFALQVTQQFTTTLPLYPGYAPDAIHTTAGATQYNYTNTTMLNWLLPCYTGWKGSLRWKALVRGNAGSSGPRGALACTRFLPSVGYALTNLLVAPNPTQSELAQVYKTLYRESAQGHAVTPSWVQPALEVEFPFYSGQRFGNARESELLTLTRSQAPSVLWACESFASTAGTTFVTVSKYFAVGEDFNMYFFNSIPYLYDVPEPPV